MGSLLRFSSSKWLLKTSDVGLSRFSSEKAVGLFFASTIIHLGLNCTDGGGPQAIFTGPPALNLYLPTLVN